VSRPDVSPSAGMSFLGTALDPMILRPGNAICRRKSINSVEGEGSPETTMCFLAVYTSGKGRGPNAGLK
jgi:hypothetical protein